LPEDGHPDGRRCVRFVDDRGQLGEDGHTVREASPRT
jgi:hypothetical protein